MHPERIGPYNIDRKIGAGGMGNVYHGVHESTGQEAAIKVLPAAMAREDGFVQRFTREIDALRQLCNRHIVQLYQDGETGDGTFYYAMEFVDGVTLTTEITNRRRIPWKEVLDLSGQVAAALKAAHDAGIVHRDLKPSNLMLTSDQTIKLTDFGVASLFASSRLTRTGGVVGTAEYMSPEQARGQRATRRSDLYSLGAVMYAMLTGRPPFTGPSASDILQKHQFAQFDRPSRFVPDLPRLVEDLVCQLLEKDPAKRLPDALVVMKRIEQIRGRLELLENTMESVTVERPAVNAGTTIESNPAAQAGVPHHPGPATLVRDLIRDDMASSLKKSPLAGFFDNTFVLVTLLGLIVAFGVWMNKKNVPDPLEKFLSAQTILDKDPGPAWIRARDDLLRPLLEAHALPSFESQIRRLITRVDDYEFCRSLPVNTHNGIDEKSEEQRLIRRAVETFHSGDIRSACRQMESILRIVSLQDDSVYLQRFLEETLQQWKEQPASSGRVLFLNRLIERLQDHHSDDGESLSAINAALELYGDDETVTEQIEQLTRMRFSVQSLDSEESQQRVDEQITPSAHPDK